MISSRSAVSSIRSSGLSLQSRLNWSSVRQAELTSKENRNGACCSIEGGRAIFASDRHHNPAFRLLQFPGRGFESPPLRFPVYGEFVFMQPLVFGINRDRAFAKDRT